MGGGAMQFMAWFGSGEMELIPLHANRFLNMMSETVVGYLLLDAAVIAAKAQKNLKESDPDWKFYEGKIQAANFFAFDTLGGVSGLLNALTSGDRSALDVPDAAFG